MIRLFRVEDDYGRGGNGDAGRHPLSHILILRVDDTRDRAVASASDLYGRHLACLSPEQDVPIHGVIRPYDQIVGQRAGSESVPPWSSLSCLESISSRGGAVWAYLEVPRFLNSLDP